MKLGVFTVILGKYSLDETLKYLKGLGVQQVEIGCGGTPGTAHADAVKFMKEPALLEEFQETIAKYGIDVAALSCHGNPVHPNKEIANKYREEFDAAILMAEKIGVHTVVGFSGCPGDCENSIYPNWSIAAWPEDYVKIREWQWEEKLIPYWKEEVKFANAHGVDKIAFELHPGFCVYNPSTLLHLREAVGPTIGANVDPSHLFWQGMDPVMAIRELKGAIYHFHAKDTKIDKYNTAVNGVLDTSNLSELGKRSWIFRTVGYGHDQQVWKDIFSELQKSGYDGIVSIEHEDGLMTDKEGLEKAIDFLKKTMIFDNMNNDMFWA
ncbi:MAG: sugar phosphate isomerase/epimerase [Lachnospiraceae bacterium]|jgi:sugar phosphate isomerase/epimerase|nr:sugar phosphate isomerase/epimerase [Lachnospiraceae bacterium]